MAATLSANSRLAKRYAKSLFELALEHKKVDVIEQDLLEIKRALGASPELQAFIATPLIDRDAKSGAIATLIEKSGGQKETVSFVKVMAKNSRLEALPEAVEAFMALSQAHRGEITAEVVTALPLQSSQQSAISSALVASLGKKVKIKAVVDPAILGGVIVTVGSKMLDNSLKGKLDKLKALDKQMLVA